MNKVLTGWPQKVIPKLKVKIDRLASEKSVKLFYIGRTSDIDATLSRHGCDDIIPLYQTSSFNNAADVEHELINYFYDYDKCDNDAPHSGGGVSEEYSDFVYVAIWH